MSLEDYEVLEFLGHGAFGEVRKVRRKSDGQVLARKEIKYAKLTTKMRAQLSAEFSILAHLKHPNIVRYFNRIHVKEAQAVHLYMEYCGQGDLAAVIKSTKKSGKLLPEHYIWSISTQIMLGLYRCHNGADPPAVENVYSSSGSCNAPPATADKAYPMVLHRDLKPDNIFLAENDQVKIGDFGLSRVLGTEELAMTFVGTPYYMSPELNSDRAYTHKSDIWSLGCLIYELCRLQPPFQGVSPNDLCRKILTGKYPPIPDAYSPGLRSVIEMCLRLDPAKRPDTGELLMMDIVRMVRRERDLVLTNVALRHREGDIRALQARLEEKDAQLLIKENKLKTAWDEQVGILRHEMGEELRRYWEALAVQKIEEQVQVQMAERFERELGVRMENEVARLERQYLHRIEAEVSARVEQQLAQRMESEVEARMKQRLQHLEAEFAAHAEKQVEQQVAQRIENEVQRRVREEVEAGIQRRIQIEVLSRVDSEVERRVSKEELAPRSSLGCTDTPVTPRASRTQAGYQDSPADIMMDSPVAFHLPVGNTLDQRDNRLPLKELEKTHNSYRRVPRQRSAAELATPPRTASAAGRMKADLSNGSALTVSEKTRPVGNRTVSADPHLQTASPRAIKPMSLVEIAKAREDRKRGALPVFEEEIPSPFLRKTRPPPN